MWKTVVKGILGGVGGGMEAAAGNSETNLSGGKSKQSNPEEEIMNNVGMLGGKIFTKLKQKKNAQNQEETENNE